MVAWPIKLSAHWNWRAGVTHSKRDPEVIVSLTSIPERIPTIHLCLESLLRQSTKPDRLILWLSETREPGRPIVSKRHLPTSLRRLQKRGLEIRWCADIGPYRKIIPGLRAYPDALIATADDDLYYPPCWLELLFMAYQRQPQYIHCHRAHRIKFMEGGKPAPYNQWEFGSRGFQGPSSDLFPTGDGGVLYAPGHLAAEVFNEGAFLALCPRADDVWLKAMSNLNGVQCKKVAEQGIPIKEIRIKNNRRLEDHNLAGGQNDVQIEAVNRAYSCFSVSTPQKRNVSADTAFLM